MVRRAGFARYLIHNEGNIAGMEHTLSIVPAAGGVTAKVRVIMNLINENLPVAINRNTSTLRVKIGNEVLSQVASTLNEMDEYYRTGEGDEDLSVATIEALMKHMFTNCSQTLRFLQVEPRHRQAANAALGLMEPYFRADVYTCFLQALECNLDTMNLSRVFPRPADY